MLRYLFVPKYLNNKYDISAIGSGALPGKMLIVRIIANNNFDAYFGSC